MCKKGAFVPISIRKHQNATHNTLLDFLVISAIKGFNNSLTSVKNATIGQDMFMM